MFFFFLGGLQQQVRQVLKTGAGQCIMCGSKADLVDYEKVLKVFFVPVWRWPDWIHFGIGLELHRQSDSIQHFNQSCFHDKVLILNPLKKLGSFSTNRFTFSVGGFLGRILPKELAEGLSSQQHYQFPGCLVGSTALWNSIGF
ncbi:hypothetical protein BVC80_1583g12 [Macleaya cordata]|uniref:Uncharacterized protein n=1 Tax=Macleaya cordata TaxID=56857 RepID=A0A200QLG1_MACCD|nr:hypothetical protein BVC80_1583g12 [Macleaya cordata]